MDQVSTSPEKVFGVEGRKYMPITESLTIKMFNNV